MRPPASTHPTPDEPGGNAARRDHLPASAPPKLAAGVAVVVDVTFVVGRPPFGFLDGPSIELGAQKSQFGTTRMKRWLGTDW
jgi:hypothetical protein